MDPNTQCFHTTDFLASQGLYKCLSWQEKEQRLNRLVNIINGHTLGSIGVVFPVSVYHSTFSPQAKRASGGPYCLAALSCLVHTSRVATQLGLLEPITG